MLKCLIVSTVSVLQYQRNTHIFKTEIIIYHDCLFSCVILNNGREKKRGRERERRECTKQFKAINYEQ